MPGRSCGKAGTLRSVSGMAAAWSGCVMYQFNQQVERSMCRLTLLRLVGRVWPSTQPSTEFVDVSAPGFQPCQFRSRHDRSESPEIVSQVGIGHIVDKWTQQQCF